MICPHCGQEHPDNFQFCPITGKKIDIIKESTSELIACTNLSCNDYGKKILPIDSEFCPTCGSPISNERSFSALFFENLKKGIINVNGIILGKTRLGDLRRMGFHKEEYSDKRVYYFTHENNIISCCVLNCCIKDLSDIIEDYSEAFPGCKLEESVFLNREKLVSCIIFNSNMITEDNLEDWEFIDILEDCGFQEIDNNDDTMVSYVSDKKICGIYHAKIDFECGDITLRLCELSQWKIKKTGELVNS